MTTSPRSLGRSGLQVSPVCFGGNVFGWTVDERTSFSLLDAWVAAGFNFIDTADVYSRWVPGQKGPYRHHAQVAHAVGRGQHQHAVGITFELKGRLVHAGSSL